MWGSVVESYQAVTYETYYISLLELIANLRS